MASIAETPIDLYKSQLQVQTIRQRADPAYKPPFTSLVQAVKRSVALNGVRGPYQGLAITALRNIPSNAVYLGSFDVFKKRLAEYQGCVGGGTAVWCWRKCVWGGAHMCP